jgi:hypothetical protein
MNQRHNMYVRVSGLVGLCTACLFGFSVPAPAAMHREGLSLRNAHGSAENTSHETGRLILVAQAETRENEAVAVTTTEEDSEASDKSIVELVDEAVEDAEEATEKAGLKYYGKPRTGILGNRLWYADFAILFADNSNIDPGIGLSTGFNFPVVPHLDLGVALRYGHQEGTLFTRNVEVDQYNIGASATASLLPEQKINPFLIAGVFYLSADVSVDGFSNTVDSEGFGIGGGIEFMVGNKASIIPAYVHSEADDIDSDVLSLLFNYWYAFKHAVRIGGGYDPDSEDYSLSIGYMYNL